MKISMRFPDRKIKNVSDLIEALRAQTKPDQTVWFRGQSDSRWKLLPSLGRKNAHGQAEFALIKRFKQNAVPHISNRPQSEWEWLFLMQHHRLPTRLLDWTESPLVGIFFAVAEKPKVDGALWCLAACGKKPAS